MPYLNLIGVVYVLQTQVLTFAYRGADYHL